MSRIFSTIIVAFLTLIVACPKAIADDPNRVAIGIKDEWHKCEKDEDCIVVYGCWYDAVNKKSVGQWRARDQSSFCPHSLPAAPVEGAFANCESTQVRGEEPRLPAYCQFNVMVGGTWPNSLKK